MSLFIHLAMLFLVIFGYVIFLGRDFWASAECQAAGAQYDAADVVCEGMFVLRLVECGGWIDLGVRSAM